MSDLISRKTALERAEGCAFTDKNEKRKFMDWLRYCLGQPTVEAVQAVHGEWISNGWWRNCSQCGEIVSEIKQSNFCPNCGADMRKRRGE